MAAFFQGYFFPGNEEAGFLHFDAMLAGRGGDFGGFAVGTPVDRDRLAVDEHLGVRLADAQRDRAVRRADSEQDGKYDDYTPSSATGRGVVAGPRWRRRTEVRVVCGAGRDRESRSRDGFNAGPAPRTWQMAAGPVPLRPASAGDPRDSWPASARPSPRRPAARRADFR